MVEDAKTVRVIVPDGVGPGDLRVACAVCGETAHRRIWRGKHFITANVIRAVRGQAVESILPVCHNCLVEFHDRNDPVTVATFEKSRRGPKKKQSTSPKGGDLL